jgi:7-carboxy-7-deazaguanine synthase
MKLARMPDGSPEIFHTLQGEGRNTGQPSIFIRASLCNLHCHWCDTDYTWNWEGTPFTHASGKKYRRADEIVDLGPEEICEAVSRFPCSHYVLTGGEPLLQETAWVDLMSMLPGVFEVETNGTLFPGPEFLAHIDQINVSPKLANSGMPESLRIKLPVLQKLAGTGKADFKFVVGGREDFEEVNGLVSRSGIASDRVFLMPKAASVAELEAAQTHIAELAMTAGFRYSDRLHLRLYGAKRGV